MQLAALLSPWLISLSEITCRMKQLKVLPVAGSTLGFWLDMIDVNDATVIGAH